jgi:NTE family protein
MHRLLGVRTFAGCRVPLAVSVFDVYSRATRVVDDGDLAAAICASCAVPGLFHPVAIDGRPCLDGGILDRPGLVGMPEREPRVLFHHLLSRSPWRRRRGTGPDEVPIPLREGMVTLVLEDLPRSGPFRLHEGRRALKVAREATRRALDRPIDAGLVRLRAD